ncbi:FAD-dependent oxidoreductase [Haloarcula pellucida]|uniref:Glycerol-3-phosphate dehydrogenase n=1 Tax=Haloarcula pellucida TaxID=1427151 RepID=A0A830GPC1_9EURY|nr:FAD-dependent oxidoreductase [Halomicroarcula pellucida]MBX0348271.1 FAD-dependent oxidoreductase [Halomicroarcula pellucida]GGN97790.1 glycerol-3-phosphate dehydrogenase [Halomicroarcula pellucida]
MTRSTTVLVVGGGATGVGVARDLSLRGVDVTLAERGGLASGTSGRSHGLLHSGARYAEADATGAEECIEENRILRDVAGECIRDTGGLFVQLTEDDPEYFEAKRDACEAVGIETDELDADAARELVPDLSPEVERAMRVPDAVIYPSRLVAANAADAEANGATIHPHAPLESLTVTDGRVTAATLGGDADETVDPDYVVNAAGAWAGQVAAKAGVDVEMAPARGVMVSVEYDSLGPVLNRCRDPDDGDIVVPHESEAVLGTTSVPVSDPDDYERADWEVDRSIEECAAMLPPVADADVVRTWWGVRPLYAPDEGDGDRRGISRGFFKLDHGDDGVENLVSVVGGKLTTYRQMAASTTDLVCERLGVEADCETATRRLPGADDGDRLDEFVARYDGQGPTDEDVVTRD